HGEPARLRRYRPITTIGTVWPGASFKPPRWAGAAAPRGEARSPYSSDGRRLHALASDLYQGPQRGIHGLGVGKELRNIGRKHHDVRAFGISLCILAPHALAEVVLREHVRVAL